VRCSSGRSSRGRGRRSRAVRQGSVVRGSRAIRQDSAWAGGRSVTAARVGRLRVFVRSGTVDRAVQQARQGRVGGGRGSVARYGRVSAVGSATVGVGRVVRQGRCDRRRGSRGRSRAVGSAVAARVGRSVAVVGAARQWSAVGAAVVVGKVAVGCSGSKVAGKYENECE